MAKKGQVMLFIIIGLVLLFAVALYVSFTYTFQKELMPLPSDALSICTEGVMKEVIADIAFHSGYSPLPESVFSTFLGDTSVYGAVPTQEDLHKALESEAQDRLPACENESRDITIGLAEGAVKASVTYRNLPSITIRIPVQLLAAQRVAEQIIKLIEKDPLVVPATQLLELQKQEKVIISEMWDDATVVYFITPEEGLPIVWAFAVVP